MAHSTELKYKGETIRDLENTDELCVGTLFFEEDTNDENKVNIYEVTSEEDGRHIDEEKDCVFYKGKTLTLKAIDWLFDRK